jgi:excisionase family DNA binding protein
MSKAMAQARAMVPVTERLLLTVPEACARAGIPRSRLYLEIAAGHIRSVKIGRLRRIPASALEEWVIQLVGEQTLAS